MCRSSSFFVSAARPVFGQTSGNGNITGRGSQTPLAQRPKRLRLLCLITTLASRASLRPTPTAPYSATFLQPGHYEITVAGAGFGKVDRKNLVLTVGQILTVDLALPAASVSSEVVVTSESPLLDTEKTSVSQTFSEQLITNLPVNTTQLERLRAEHAERHPGWRLRPRQLPRISGLYNQNYVDGSNNNQMLFSEARGRASGAPYVYSIDSIKEFQAETSTTPSSSVRLQAVR